MNALNDQLLAAHATGDQISMVRLYTQAGDQAPSAEAAAFYLTQAYIYALDAGAPQALDLHARLVTLGAEADT